MERDPVQIHEGVALVLGVPQVGHSKVLNDVSNAASCKSFVHPSHSECESDRQRSVDLSPKNRHATDFIAVEGIGDLTHTRSILTERPDRRLSHGPASRDARRKTAASRCEQTCATPAFVIVGRMPIYPSVLTALSEAVANDPTAIRLRPHLASLLPSNGADQ